MFLAIHFLSKKTDTFVAVILFHSNQLVSDFALKIGCKLESLPIVFLGFPLEKL